MTRQVMWCHRSCDKSGHGNGMGDMGSMADVDRLRDGEPIWCHQSHVPDTI